MTPHTHFLLIVKCYTKIFPGCVNIQLAYDRMVAVLRLSDPGEFSILINGDRKMELDYNLANLVALKETAKRNSILMIGNTFCLDHTWPLSGRFDAALIKMSTYPHMSRVDYIKTTQCGAPSTEEKYVDQLKRMFEKIKKGGIDFMKPTSNAAKVAHEKITPFDSSKYLDTSLSCIRWTEPQETILLEQIKIHGSKWVEIGRVLEKPADACRKKFERLMKRREIAYSNNGDDDEGDKEAALVAGPTGGGSASAQVYLSLIHI